MAMRSRVDAIISSIVTVHPHEITALIHSSSCFFFILSAYFIILPLRDDGAISLGLGNLPGLFVGSLLLTLVAAPASTLIFYLPNLSKSRVSVSHSSPVDDAKGELGQGSPTHFAGWGNHGWFCIVVRIGFFLWVALLNLITISSTWARVIDVMDNEYSVRFKIVWLYWCWSYTRAAFWLIVCS